MASITEQIRAMADVCREQGIEPNRVRVGPSTYRQIFMERTKGKDAGLFECVSWMGIDNMAIEVWYSCPPDAIYVDVKPDNEELGDLETRLRAEFGYRYANQP